ncbi:hypothetical protein [Zestomonas carbonaria]|uniref:SH3 domain-containing protein n=1 Tax=Zestomonas carbonaria TaxID=2762745 RepID=A0A7U7ESZ7_9GAMM|nr:hypothetical protein [Pseudomonas carbonaria]CAD5110599.1 hypothetical protein PSEWESI4_04922 [Pseudomonas carbonaria]
MTALKKFKTNQMFLTTATLPSLLLLTSPPPLSASETLPHYNLKITERSNELKIESCIKEKCKTINLPKELTEQYEEDHEITIDDIDRNNTPEIVATAHGVNRCSTFYKYESDTNSLKAISPTEKTICNYTTFGEYVFSKHRDGATWYEEVYRREDGQLILIGKDRCLGCGQVFRTIYQDKKPIEKMVVNDKESYFDRTQLSSVVSVDKSILFNEPSDSSPTKMYLIKGDSVQLVDYSDEGNGWYLVRYNHPQKTAIQKWVHCSDLKVCGNY